MNNKGFAVSIILYSITAVAVVILFLILSVNAANVRNQENVSETIKKEISGLPS